MGKFALCSLLGGPAVRYTIKCQVGGTKVYRITSGANARLASNTFYANVRAFFIRNCVSAQY